ncbi:MAG: hypothetical protein ACFE95_05755 [Candidatus Hodarchaeota archaeon]
MENLAQSPKIILLDFFTEIESDLEEVLNFPMIHSFCEHIADLTLVFSDISNDHEVSNFISKTDLPIEEISGLKNFFKNPFQTSFSYGYKNREFVFIRLEKTSQLLNQACRDGLKGLILHELLHSVQRQRGLEVRLSNSLVFSLDFFTELASIVPPDIFIQEDLITFLKQISQVALFTLKDIYVNVEMIKRGMGDLLINFYSIDLRSGEPEFVSPPEFDTPFQKGKITIKDLDAFAKAFNYTISLIPVWLPMMVLEADAKDYESSRTLKHFIFNSYYINPSLITREMWHIENIFLTNFSFSKSFHMKWFGAIFNLALEYLLGEDFVFYHLSKATELIEEIYGEKMDNERRSLAMVPILKAAYVHMKEYPVGIQQRNIDELLAGMKRYAIDQEEILELEESLNEMVQDEGSHVGHFFQNLIHLSIMILSKDFREEVVHGHQKSIKPFGRTILTLLQTLNYLGDECDDVYYHSIRLTTKQLIRSDNLFKQKKLATHLEIIAKEAIYTSDIEPSPSEVEELLFNFDFFEVPLTNMFIDLGISFIHNIKIVMNKVPINDPEFPILISQFISVLLGEKEFSVEDQDQTNMILVSSLISTSGVPFDMIQPVLRYFMGFSGIGTEDQ